MMKEFGAFLAIWLGCSLLNLLFLPGMAQMLDSDPFTALLLAVTFGGVWTLPINSFRGWQEIDRRHGATKPLHEKDSR